MGQGLLCTFCKYLVMDLIRLQKELKTVESIIVRTFKNSEDTDDRSGSSGKQHAYSRIEPETNETIKIYRVKENKKSLSSNHKRHKSKRQTNNEANHEKEVENVDKKQKTNFMRKSLKRKTSEGVENNKTYKDCIEKTDNNHNKGFNKQSLRENKVETVLENGNCLYDSDDVTKEDEAVYNIEALIAKKDGEYLVKWENYPDSENTWEPASCIPDTIIEYYQRDSDRLGQPLPKDFTRFEYDAIEDEDGEVWEPEENIKENYYKEKEKKLKKRNTKHKRRRTLPIEDFKPKPRDVTKRRIECLMARNNQKYLVKWENLPDDENTWEHKSSIPKNTLKYYESDLSLLGTSPPKLDIENTTYNNHSQDTNIHSPGGNKRKLFSEPAGPQLLT